LHVSERRACAALGQPRSTQRKVPHGRDDEQRLTAWFFQALISFLFAAVFKVLPDCELQWRDVVVGAVITAILFVAGKSIIGWYVGSSAVASTYGAAAGLIVLLLWVYYTSQIFLFGAELATSRAAEKRLQANCRCGKKPICWPKEPRKPTPTGGSMLSNREVEQYRELGYLVTAQLIDATHGTHLWGDRYDRDLTDIFEVQDEVTHRIVEALKITLSPAEKQRLAGAETANIAAYDCVLRGREFMLSKEKTRETFEQAINCFKKALEHDPNYSLASACLGFGYVFDYQNRWTEDPDSSLPIAKEYARQAIEKDPKEPLAHCVTGLCASFEKDLDRATTEIEIALSLNPNLALAHNLRGTVRIYSGQQLEAISDIEQAMRLDPALNSQSIHFLGMAYLLAGKYETAAALLRQRIILMPKTDFSRALLTSALGHLGEVDEARQVWAELMEINPNYSFAAHAGRQPFKREEDIERIAGGLRKAGVLS
jgi:tetratricopeptide (TPR) repeat protein